jgi:hypothetical protein
LHLNDGKTLIEPIEAAEVTSQRLLLADLGASLADVFGADNELWVEGPTEGECMPKIIRRFIGPLFGTAVVGVKQTGDFDGKRAQLTVEIYERLSSGSVLAPPAVAFIFDREIRTEKEIDDLTRFQNVHLLPRRMYENYLLNSSAIAAVLSATDATRPAQHSPAEVERWIVEHRWEAKYFARLPVPPEEKRSEAVWLQDVNGARVLTDLFGELTEQRVPYDKVRHGVALTDWLLEHAPDALRELGDLLSRALGRETALLTPVKAVKAPKTTL